MVKNFKKHIHVVFVLLNITYYIYKDKKWLLKTINLTR